MGAVCSAKTKSSPAVAEIATPIKDKYLMTKTLGKGGSCSVIMGVLKTQPESRPVAVKIMSRQDSHSQELYDHEVNLLSQLDHPNILKMVEYGDDEKNYYIVSECCTGGELFDRIVDKKSMITEKKAAKMIETMLLAVQYCHERNIVHRDLKPENFVFKSTADDAEMVLIDFGCAKVVDDNEAYKDLVGTPYYLAPESAAGHKYTRTGAVLKASDVWSIGVIAYVLMTGRPPFNGRSNNQIFSAIIKKKIKFPTNVKLSKSFMDFVRKMLKKSPKQRITLEEALTHPWVTGQDASNDEISNDVIKVLRQFAQQSKLKKAITKTLATHMGKEPELKIKAHFERLDKNNSGGLDQEELALLLEDMGITKSKAIDEAKAIILATDDDGSGEIEFKEFAQIWQRKLLSVNESYIHAVFTVLDENGDGEIDPDELKKVLDLKDGAGEADTIMELISEVDKNGDGKISFDEFRQAMLEANKDEGSGLDGKVVGQDLNPKELEQNAAMEDFGKLIDGHEEEN